MTRSAWRASPSYPSRYPKPSADLFTAMGNIVPSHLMDRNLYPFQTLQTSGAVNPDGDRAFDEDDDCGPAGPTARIQLRRDG